MLMRAPITVFAFTSAKFSNQTSTEGLSSAVNEHFILSQCTRIKGGELLLGADKTLIKLKFYSTLYYTYTMLQHIA